MGEGGWERERERERGRYSGIIASILLGGKKIPFGAF